VTTPTYVQAGREDHIAPPQSVWKITHHFRAAALRARRLGPYRRRGQPARGAEIPILDQRGEGRTLEEFIAGATETKGSWWPDWIAWIRQHSGEEVPAKGARVPGKGKLKAIEDAPGKLCEGALRPEDRDADPEGDAAKAAAPAPKP
jgi:polyhydroxyalkanoate synthase